MKVLNKVVLALAFSLSTACGSTADNLNEVENAAIETLEGEAAAVELGARGFCSPQIPSQFPTGFSDSCLKVGGTNREYRVYHPAQAIRKKKITALVIALHGGGGSGVQASDPRESALAGFTRIADNENFLVVYPSGLADEAKGKRGWNDCRSDDTSKAGADDVGFLQEIISQTRKKYKLSRNQIFIAGTSNGAMMSYRFAMEKSLSIGGVAAASGNIAKSPAAGRCRKGPEHPVPILMTHGTKDPIVPYSGGCVALIFGSKCLRGEVQSADATIQFWLRANGLSRVQPAIREFNVNVRDGGNVIEKKYYSKGSAVTTYTLNGAGHPTPSKTIDKSNLVVGKQNRDIEFAEVAWEFFKAQQIKSY